MQNNDDLLTRLIKVTGRFKEVRIHGTLKLFTNILLWERYCYVKEHVLHSSMKSFLYCSPYCIDFLSLYNVKIARGAFKICFKYSVPYIKALVIKPLKEWLSFNTKLWNFIKEERNLMYFSETTKRGKLR